MQKRQKSHQQQVYSRRIPRCDLCVPSMRPEGFGKIMQFRKRRPFSLFWQFVILFVVLQALGAFSIVSAQTTHTVTNGSDSDPGSLRDILGGSLTSGDSIVFDSGVTMIDLTGGQISRNIANLTIKGNDLGTPDALKDALTILIADVKLNGIADLQDKLLALPYATPTITGTIDVDDVPAGVQLIMNGGLINLPNAGTRNISLLTFQDGNFSYKTLDENNPTGHVDTRLSVYGGAIYPGGTYMFPLSTTLRQTAFLNNILSVTSGNATSGNTTSTARADTVAGASGGGGFFQYSTDIVDSVFFGNTLIAISETATGGTIATGDASAESYAHVTGGGGYFGSTATVTNSMFSGNTITATSKAATGGTAIGGASGNAYAEVYGGGAAFSYSATITDSVFSSNTATANGGIAIGNSASATAGVLGGGVFFANPTETTSITNSVLSGNTVNANGGIATALGGNDADAHATAGVHGGGAFFYNPTTITDSIFSENTINATGGTAIGGNANNDAYTYAFVFVSGGGAFFIHMAPATIRDSVFSGNTINVIGGTATSGNANNDAHASAFASAYGGGGDFVKTVTAIDSAFSGNTINAIGGAKASGGVGIRDWANADAYAFGGGVFLDGTTSTFTNVSFEGNCIRATADGTVVQQTAGAYNGTAKAYALGAAIFVSNSYSSENRTVDLIADNGTVLIAGNTANGTPSGIHFGRSASIFQSLVNDTGYFLDSAEESTLNITATNAGDKVLMYDPLTVEAYRGTTDMGTAAFAMNVKSGLGEFVWGGKNILDANGGSTVTFENGSTTMLAHDFTLTTTANIDYRTGSAHDAYAMASTTNPGGNTNLLTVVLESGSTLSFNLARDEKLAMFDFTNATGETFTVESSVNFGTDTDTSRQIISVDKAYLVADGITQAEAEAGELNFSLISPEILGFEIRDNVTAASKQLWTKVIFNSQYGDLFYTNINSMRAAESLNKILQDKNRVSDDEFNAIVQNANAVTVEYAASRGAEAMRSTGSFADLAAYKNFEYPGHWSAPCHFKNKCAYRGNSPYGNSNRRVWGGYLGEFGAMEAHARREKYHTTLHGLFVGTDWRFNSNTIFGVYGGFMDESLMFKSIDSQVDSDGLQFGLFAHHHLGGGNTLSTDISYAHFENDSRRFLNNYTTSSSFDQDLMTVGLSWEHRIRTDSFEFSPFVRLRYTNLNQESLYETGNSVTASSLDGLNGNSFVGRLGSNFATRCFGWESRLNLAWAHEYGDTCVTGGSQYHLGGNFNVSSAVLDRNRLEMGARFGRNWELRSSQLGVNLGYDLTTGKHTTQHAVFVAATARF